MKTVLAIPIVIMVLIIAAAVYASRPSPAQVAERKYEFLSRNNGNMGDICLAARAVENAYADAGDDANFKEWRTTADIDCKAGLTG